MATSTTSRSGERGAPAKTSGDQARPTAPRATLPSVNPYNGQTLKTYLEMSAEDVDNAIARAHERFSAWRRVTFAQRASLLLGCPLRGAELDGRKRGAVEVLDQRSAMCRSDRPTVPGRGLPNERLHEPRANIGIRVVNRVTWRR